jgi:hypothetical protein
MRDNSQLRRALIPNGFCAWPAPEAWNCPAFAEKRLKIPTFLPRCGHRLRSLSGWGTGKPEIAEMTIKASKPAAWILAVGLFACMGASSFAAEGSPWPAAAATAQPSAGGQQANAPDAAAATDQSATDPTAAQQPDTVERSLATEQRPADAATPAETADATSVQTASGDQGSGWDKASIVGKIFIAAGTLLTLGSAARMFMI